MYLELAADCPNWSFPSRRAWPSTRGSGEAPAGTARSRPACPRPACFVDLEWLGSTDSSRPTSASWEREWDGVVSQWMQPQASCSDGESMLRQMRNSFSINGSMFFFSFALTTKYLHDGFMGFVTSFSFISIFFVAVGISVILGVCPINRQYEDHFLVACTRLFQSLCPSVGPT